LVVCLLIAVLSEVTYYVSGGTVHTTHCNIIAFEALDGYFLAFSFITFVYKGGTDIYRA